MSDSVIDAPSSRDDEGGGDFAHAGVRHADHGGLAHAVHGGQTRFDFGGGDVFATDFEHVLCSGP